jgi:hypothetical protein
MLEIIREPIKIEVRASNGEWYDLNGLVTSLVMTQDAPIEITELGDIARRYLPSSGTSFTIQGIVGPEGFQTFSPTERYEQPMYVPSEACCRFCGSGWTEDKRGHCDSCGAPKGMAI